MFVRCKFKCHTKTNYADNPPTGLVRLSPSYEYDPASATDPTVANNAVRENEMFGKATPSGSLEMYILNPVAYEKFEVGKQYYLEISQAPD